MLLNYGQSYAELVENCSTKFTKRLMVYVSRLILDSPCSYNSRFTQHGSSARVRRLEIFLNFLWTAAHNPA